MHTNTVVTSVGTFVRKSTTVYAFAAVAEAAVNPEQGLRVVGNRKGDPGLGSQWDARVRYHLVWSRTEAGARKNAESYIWAKTRVVGVFPVVAP